MARSFVLFLFFWLAIVGYMNFDFNISVFAFSTFVIEFVSFARFFCLITSVEALNNSRSHPVTKQSLLSASIYIYRFTVIALFTYQFE